VKLEDAWWLCEWWQAKLIITDPDDPLCWGRAEPNGFGTLYMWTMGHTVPMLQCQFMSDMPPKKAQDTCVCGDKHGFPKVLANEKNYELWCRLQMDERWEPVCGMTILDALIRKPLGEETDE